MRNLLTISLLLLFLPLLGQENKISIKKKLATTDTENNITGFYYSQPMVEEFNNGGINSHRQTRYYLWISADKEVFLSTSPLQPKKFLKKLAKNGNNMAAEKGNYSISESSLYITTVTTNKKFRSTFRYVGEIMENYLFLIYKASERQKVALDLYFYPYDGIKSI